MAARIKFGIVLASFALLGGCGEDSDPGPVVNRIEMTAPTSLVDLIAAAPTTIPYDMTRRCEAYWGTGLQANSLIHRERIYADGAGKFGIEPLAVLEPSMSTNAENLFLLVQRVRAGFFFRHRDFGIRDVGRFNRHWQVFDTGLTTQILGRVCARLQVQRQRNPSRVYHLAVDLANGLVLRSEEKTLAGNTIALVEVESLNLRPSLGGMSFHQPVTKVSQLNSSSPGQPRLPFVAAQPKLLPQGYRLSQRSAVTDPNTGEIWARFIYSDGLEEIFFLHGGSGAQLKTSGASSGGGGKAEDAVKYVEMGSWTVVWGEVGGERLIVMAKLPRGELFDLIESAFS